MKGKSLLILSLLVMACSVAYFAHASEESADGRKVIVDWYYEMSRLERILEHLIVLMENPQEGQPVFTDLWKLLHQRLKFLCLFAPNLEVGEYEWAVIGSEYRQMASELDALQQDLKEMREDNDTLRATLLALVNEKEMLRDQIEALQLEVVRWQEAAKPKPVERKEGPGMEGDYYVVQPGDTLWRISRRTGVPLDTLRELNGLEGSQLLVGQRLRLKP